MVEYNETDDINRNLPCTAISVGNAEIKVYREIDDYNQEDPERSKSEALALREAADKLEKLVE